MTQSPKQACALGKQVVHGTRWVAALVVTLAPHLTHADSQGCSGVTDPSISCDLVQPPAMSSPGFPQLPGFVRRNTEGGNLVTTIPISGSLSIFHSSQSRELQNGSPRENEGFGEGFTAVSRLTPRSINGGYALERRTADGAIVRYVRTNSGLFLSEDREFGDLSQVVAINGGFEVQIADGSRYQYTTQVGESYYLTNQIDPFGRETRFSFSGKTLTQVQDVALNRTTSFTVGNDGIISEAVDFNGLKTKLTYTNNQLASVTYPDGRGYTITYDQDGFGYITQLTTPDKRTETYAYYQFGILRAMGQRDRLVTFGYKPTEVAAEFAGGASTWQFTRTKYSNGHPTETWQGDGSLSRSAVLTSKTTYSGHQLTESLDSFGGKTKFFYNADSACEAATGTAAQSPLPTCIVSSVGTKTQITRNWQLFGAPTRVVVTGPGGSSPIVSEFQYAGPGRVLSTKTTRDGVETSRVTIAYQGLLPVSTTSTALTKVLAFDSVVKGRPLSVLTPGGSQIESQFSPLGFPTSRTIDGVQVTSEYGEASSGQATYSSKGAGVALTTHANFDGTQSDGFLKGAGDPMAHSLGSDPGVAYAANAVEGQIRARMKPGFTANSLQERLESVPLSQASQLVPNTTASWNSSATVGSASIVDTTRSKLASGDSASSWRTTSTDSWSATDNKESHTWSSGYK